MKLTVMIGEFALEALLAFLAGIALAAFHVSFFAGAAVAIAAALWLKYARRLKSSVLFLAGGAFLFGCFYYGLYVHAAAGFLRLPSPGETFEGVVQGEPRLSNRLARFEIELQEPYRGRVGVAVSIPDVQYGDLLSFRGTVQKGEGGMLLLQYPQTTMVARHRGNWLKNALYEVKHAVIRGFERSLPPDQAALLSGITLGARSTFSKELRDDMATSGTIHIVAVSGYNISVLASNIGKIAVLFLSRRLAVWVSIGAILLFVGMVGAEASVVRAALMGIMGLIAEGTGRPKDQAYAIAMAAALMAAWDPTIIREDLGFSLSFLSLLGVTYIAPALQSLWREAKNKGVLSWKENVDTTLGAQLGVLPVLLTAFGSVSLTSVLANILILPFIPFTMAAGFLLGVLNHVSSLLAFPLAEIAAAITSYEIGIIRLFAHVVVPIGNFFSSPLVIAVYYLLLGALIAWRARIGPSPRVSS